LVYWQLRTPVSRGLRAGAHHLVADEPATGGGGDVGPSPFGLLLSGLAACTAMTLRHDGHDGTGRDEPAPEFAANVGDVGPLVVRLVSSRLGGDVRASLLPPR